MRKKRNFIILLVGLIIIGVFAVFALEIFDNINWETWWVKFGMACGGLIAVIGLNGLTKKYTIFDETIRYLKKLNKALQRLTPPIDSAKELMAMISVRNQLSNSINDICDIHTQYDVHKLNNYIPELQAIAVKLSEDNIENYTEQDVIKDTNTIKTIISILESSKI